MKALITGGAGFIGSHLAERLLLDNWEITILDNESTGFRRNVPRGVRYLKGDVRDMAALGAAFDPAPDVVFHLAAQVSNILSYADPREDITTNIIGTYNVLDWCHKAGVERFMQASSMALYGQPSSLPVDEKCRVAPLSFYGISKLAAENYVFSAGRRTDVKRPCKVTALRMFNVYGPRQSLTNMYQGVVSVFVANVLRGDPITLYGTGEQTRDFVYISDIVDAWMKALHSPASPGEVFNIGSGEEISVGSMLDKVLGLFGESRATYPIIPKPDLQGDQRAIRADIRKAKSMLGWSPRVMFDQGLAETVAWARSLPADAWSA